MSGASRLASVRRAATLVVAAVVFGFAWLLRFNDPSGAFGGLTDDHFFYVVRGWQILFGDLPVRDFADHGAPGYFYVAAAVQAIFGRGTLSELVFSTTALALGASLTFWLAARASGSLLFGLVGAVFHVFLGPRFYNYPKILVYAAAIPAIWALADRQTTGRVALMSAITAAGFMLRHDHGAFVGIAVLTMLIVLRGVPWRQRARHAVVYALMVLALLSPYLAFLELNGGLRTYFDNAAAWAERDRGRAEVVWPGLFDNPDGQREEAREGPLLQRLRATYRDNAVAWLYYTMLAVPLVALAVLAFGRDGFTRGWPLGTEKLIVVAVLGIVLNAGFFRSPLAARLADPSVPHAILIAWLGAAAVRAFMSREPLRPWCSGSAWGARAAIVMLLAPIALVVALLLTDDTYDRLDKSSLVERVGKPFERAGEIAEVVAAAWPVDPSAGQQSTLKLAAFVRACTVPTDRVLVTPYQPQILAMADRAFAGGHADLRAGFFSTEVEQQRTIERLERQSVPYVVFDTGEMQVFREGFPLIVKHLDEHYDNAGTRAVDDRLSFTLLVRKGVARPRTWAPLDWPCVR